jgi:hypothetical protein
MNNPLAQKYNYYLNESNRLNEELKTEESYSELLENVLFDILGEEDFTKLFEYVMRGTVTQDERGNALSADRSARRAKRIGEIIKIGRNSVDTDITSRAATSLVAKGAIGADVKDSNKEHSRYASVRDALRTGNKIEIKHDRPLDDPSGTFADSEQKRISKIRRNKIQNEKLKKEKDSQSNTF